MGGHEVRRRMSDEAAADASAAQDNTRLRRLGLAAAAIALIVDQAFKLWLLFVFAIESRGAVRVTPFFDLVLVWNTGISYGLFPTDGATGQTVLVLLKIAAVAFLAVWLWRAAGSRIVAIGLGLIIGGAIGNTIDRLAYGAVVDFALFHVQISGFDYRWYVFNLADVAIVAGVAGLLYDSLWGGRAKKAP
jgi:signal peptidase II